MPTEELEKFAVPPVKLTTSVPTAELNVRELIVAALVPSYSLFDAVMDGVNTLAVISAVVVALVEERE